MPNIGGPELIVVLLLAVLLFGAKKLPDLGSSFGKSIKNFKKGVAEAGEDDVAADGTVKTGATASANGQTDRRVD